MTQADAVAVLLRRVDHPAEPRAEFADALRAHLVAALTEPPAVRTRRRPARRRRLVLAAISLGLALAAVATAAYYATRSTPAAGIAGPARTGPVTALDEDAIVLLRPDGRLPPSGRPLVVWRCPRPRFCGGISSFAWSPDGRRLVFAVRPPTAPSGVAGLHILRTSDGIDTVIPPRRTGCPEPYDLAWSPDASQIVYTCLGDLHVVRPDGSERTMRRFGFGYASSPSWSPDGRRLAYALRLGGRSSVFVADGDGSNSRLLATGATAPAWSPDGSRIAYRAGCGGIRLTTPDGRDVTPPRGDFSCRTIGTPGVPFWSPDGRRIGIATRRRGTWEMNADGTGLSLLTTIEQGVLFPHTHPVWRPVVAVGRESARACASCRGRGSELP